MSFVSNVYIIKTLSTAKALTLQESQVYRDISEIDIYSDTYFTACFGEGAYACMDELQDTEALADATEKFFELVNTLTFKANTISFFSIRKWLTRSSF